MSYQAVPGPAYSPQRPPSDTRGLGAGIASIVCAVLAPVIALVGVLTFMAFGLFGHPIPFEVVQMVVGLLELLAVVCGVVAIKRAKRMNAGRITGIIGVAIAGLAVTWWFISWIQL
jgi:hypothetical protein